MSWRVVVADRLAESGLRLLAGSPEIEVVNVAGKRDELERALAGAHALIVRARAWIRSTSRRPHGVAWP